MTIEPSTAQRMASPAGATNRDDPDWKCPAFHTMKVRWQRDRDVRGGTDVLRAKKETYLPRFQVEDDADWTSRVNMTVVVDFLEQAIGTFTGLAFPSDPELGERVPAEIQQDWENLDGEGTHGAVFARDCFNDALGDGHVAILVEMPATDHRPTLAEQQARAIRPYAVRLTIDQLLSWRTRIVGGERILSQVVIEETSDEASGAFGSVPVTRWRVYKQTFDTTEAGEEVVSQGIVLWELWELARAPAAGATSGPAAPAQRFEKVREGRLWGPTRIPIAIAYGGKRTGVLQSKPPLDGLAHSNIRWAQVMSERAHSLHKCGIPIPVIIGELIGNPSDGETEAADSIVFSSSRGIHLKGGGDFKIAEAQGTALEEARQELEDTEKRMGMQALAFLQRDTASAETATAHRMTRAREQSKIELASRSLEDALELTLQYFCDYRGLDRESIDVTLPKDISDLLDEQFLPVLERAADSGKLTIGTFLKELKRSGRMSNDFDPREEEEALKREMGADSLGGAGSEPELMDATQLAALEARVQQRRAALTGSNAE